MISSTTIFDVRSVSKHFGGIAALSDVGFRVCAGEVLGLTNARHTSDACRFYGPPPQVSCRIGAQCIAVNRSSAHAWRVSDRLHI
jgi:ABC-type phosphonate transport system ATPase subunit